MSGLGQRPVSPALPVVPSWRIGSGLGESPFPEHAAETSLLMGRLHTVAAIGAWPETPIRRASTPFGLARIYGVLAGEVLDINQRSDVATVIGKLGSLAESSLAQGRSGPAVYISKKAEEFARAHGLWGSLTLMKALLLRDSGPLVKINVDVIPDLEVNRMMICFDLATRGRSVSDILTFDEKVRELMYDQIPPDDQIHMGVRFESS